MEAVFGFMVSMFRGLTRDILAPFLRKVLGLAVDSIIPACFAYLTDGAIAFLSRMLSGNARTAMR